jgi:hypothetical protein
MGSASSVRKINKEDAVQTLCQNCGALIQFDTSPVDAHYSSSVLIQEIANLRAQLAGEKATNARLQGMFNQATMRISELENPQKCCRCGTTTDVSLGPDPYASDVNNDDTPVWECGNCRHESAMDV